MGGAGRGARDGAPGAVERHGRGAASARGERNFTSAPPRPRSHTQTPRRHPDRHDPLAAFWAAPRGRQAAGPSAGGAPSPPWPCVRACRRVDRAILGRAGRLGDGRSNGSGDLGDAEVLADEGRFKVFVPINPGSSKDSQIQNPKDPQAKISES